MKARKYKITIKTAGKFTYQGGHQVDEICVQLMEDLNLIVNEDACFMLSDQEAKERTENVGEWKWIDLSEDDCASLAEAINQRDELMLNIQQKAGISVKPVDGLRDIICGTQPMKGPQGFQGRKVDDDFVINTKPVVDPFDEIIQWISKIQEMVRSRHDLKPQQIPPQDILGIIQCPRCNSGEIEYGISSYNGHMRANCSTADCINFVE